LWREKIVDRERRLHALEQGSARRREEREARD
jgi:hypothetical protein